VAGAGVGQGEGRAFGRRRADFKLRTLRRRQKLAESRSNSARHGSPLLLLY
jgi:hypothetical protein